MNIYHDKSDYYDALQLYVCTPGKILNGIGYVFSKGEWVDEKEYNRHNSRPTYQPLAKENYDKSNITPEIIVKR